MGSPLEPVLASIFMVELENLIVPVTSEISFWYRYVDDVIACINIDKITETLQKINSINRNIQFTMEQEKNSILAKI